MGKDLVINIDKNNPGAACEFTEILEELISNRNCERISDAFPDHQGFVMRFKQVVRNCGFELLMIEIHGNVIDQCCGLLVQMFENVSLRFLQTGMIDFDKCEFLFEIETMNAAIVASAEKDELIDAIVMDGFQRHYIDEPRSGQATAKGTGETGVDDLADDEVESGYSRQVGDHAKGWWQEIFCIWVMEEIAPLAGKSVGCNGTK